MSTWHKHSRAGRLERSMTVLVMTDSLVSYHQSGRVFTADGRSICVVNVSRGRGREVISGTERASGSCQHAHFLLEALPEEDSLMGPSVTRILQHQT